MAPIPPLQRAQVCGGWCHQWYKEGAKWSKEWLVLVNKLPFFSLFLSVPYIGVSMEQQRFPSLDQFERWFHIIHDVQCFLPWFPSTLPQIIGLLSFFFLAVNSDKNENICTSKISRFLCSIFFFLLSLGKSAISTPQVKVKVWCPKPN